ncbi:biosynthetic peptidoglycan transglycosylase [Salinisphaera aquimarina]|uniref:Biosynthetic peptidoglycan transglycosylase n=1 Tax=Salinisphaera aquimarina TaxID=2094031 RepID=A0ABV7EKG5_9GAMM
MTSKPKLRPRFLRNLLLSVNFDLFAIHDVLSLHVDQSRFKLSTFESLVLVLEDRRFKRHIGIDVKSVLRNIFYALIKRRHGGGSTIDMQLVRTITNRREKTIRRKLREMLLAVLLQLRYSKLTILRSYISIAYFGTGLDGAAAASCKCFNKLPSELSVDEAACVASMLVYPRPRTPSEAWQLKIDRRASYGKAVYIANPEKFK